MTTILAQTAADTLLRLIASGQVDPYLREMNQALIARMRMSDVIKGIDIKTGDTVRVTDECRPQKYRGLTGVVTGKKDKWILVDVKSFYGGGMTEYRFTPGILEVIS